MSSPNIHIPAFSKRERKYSRTHPNNIIINNLLLRSLNINYFSTVCNSNDEVELLGSIQANSLSMSSWVNLFLKMYMGFPGGASGKEPACRCRRHKRRGFNPWVGKIPWRRAWQPIPVFLPIDSHGQRSLAGYSLWGCRCCGMKLPRVTEVNLHNAKDRRECDECSAMLKLPKHCPSQAS